MPLARIDNLLINFEEYGSGSTVVLIPGMRNGLFSVRPTAMKLKDKFRVIIYDRTNCGASSVNFDGDASEAHRWAGELFALLTHLKAWPVHLGAYSLGGSVALLLATHHPKRVRSVFIGWVTGGNFDKTRLNTEMYTQYIDMAARQGMAGVCRTSHFAQMIKENPENERLLMSTPVETFVAAMKRWSSDFLQPSPVTPLRPDEFKIDQPTLIIGGDDDVHLTESAVALSRIIKSSKYLPPLIPKSEWKKFTHPSQIAEWRAQTVPPLYLSFLSANVGSDDRK